MQLRVARGGPRIWRRRLRNRRNRLARYSVFSAVEFCLWDAQDDATNFQRNLSIGEVEVVDGVICHKTEYRERHNRFAYFACSEPLAGYDTDRDAFLGPLPERGSTRIDTRRVRPAIEHWLAAETAVAGLEALRGS